MSDRNAGSSKLGRVVAVIPAGGTGTRMGSETPKQFLPLGGGPLLLHSLWAFDQAPRVDADILVVPAKQERCLAQNPQDLRRAVLLEAYEKAVIECLKETDDAALVERLRH